MNKLYYINNIDCLHEGETNGDIYIPEEDFPKFIELLENLNKNSRYRYMLLEKPKTAENVYKETTDAYFKLFKSFVDSGFHVDHAIELTKAWCNSQVAGNIVNLERKRRYGNPYEGIEHLRKYMQERSAKNESPKPEIKEENL